MNSSDANVIFCVPQMTLLRVDLSSPSCVALARQQGLDCSPALVRRVAQSRRVEMLQRLHTELHCVLHAH
jgi:hypothetical protein